MPNDLAELKDLERYFPENARHVEPLQLPDPDSEQLSIIDLPIRTPPPKIVIADDDKSVIKGTERSWQAFYKHALDIRYWQPTDKLNLLDTLEQWQEQEQWKPDVVVLDINFADGGKHGGLHYLAELRQTEGYAALAVVLATGNKYRDIDAGQVTNNLTNIDPAKWLEIAKQYQPEAVLYGKTGDAKFLGRIGEHIEDWKLSARRRAWVRLLQQVAEKLDGTSVRVQDVGQVIVEFVVKELGVDSAYVRRRLNTGEYELVCVYPEQNHVKLENKINIEPVPLLEQIVTSQDGWRALRDPVSSASITKEEAGYFPNLIGQRFLGIGAVLGARNAGFITLLRDKNKAEFSKEDQPYLTVLARLLASALRVMFLRDMQTGLLKFSDEAAKASHAEQVCKALVETLHRELHNNDDEESKTTVRLLDFATGELKRKFHLGLPAKDTQIFLNSPNSNYAQVVRENQLKRFDDVRGTNTFVETLDKDKNKKEVVITSELCVPLSLGTSAIGAVNLEHKSEDFYRHHDEDFVLAAATLAANAIERIRKNKLLEGMTEFVLDFATTPYQKLEEKLHDLLFEFCGFSVLVVLNKPQQEHQPWQIHDIDCRYKGSKEKSIRSELEKYCLNTQCWGKTWESQKIQTAQQDNWAWFTNEQCNQIDLTSGGMIANPKTGYSEPNKTPQKATALLLIKHHSSAPHRAFLLMWALPPPMNAADIEHLLGKLARLFSELDERKQQVQILTEEKLISEQAVSIAHVMQHFRHHFGNLTGGLKGHIDRVEEAYLRNKPERLPSIVQDLRANAQDIAKSFNKSTGYIKQPEIQSLSVRKIVLRACKYLKKRTQTQTVKWNFTIDKSLTVYADLDIAALVLYSLLENALDAVKGKTDAEINISAQRVEQHIVLHVTDNGGGVPESFRDSLFQWGRTTKPDGLGSALSFARTRMELMHGTLEFPPTQPAQGALFTMQFALPPEQTS